MKPQRINLPNNPTTLPAAEKLHENQMQENLKKAEADLNKTTMTGMTAIDDDSRACNKHHRQTKEKTMTDTNSNVPVQDDATTAQIKNIISAIVAKAEHPDQTSALAEVLQFANAKAQELGIDPASIPTQGNTPAADANSSTSVAPQDNTSVVTGE